jgi:hypothetical protein
LRFYGSDDVMYGLLGYNAVYFTEIPTFRLLVLVSLLILRHWRWRKYYPPKRRALSEIYGVKTQETILFNV